MSSVTNKLVLISMKTLRPDVEDYWLEIPPNVGIISQLKSFLAKSETFCGEDVDLYMNSGLLRDETNVTVIRDETRVEIRRKSHAIGNDRTSALTDNNCPTRDNTDTKTSVVNNKCHK